MSCSSVDTSVRSLLQRAYLCIEQGTSANQQSLEDEVELVHRYLSKNDAWEGVTMSQNKELLLCLTDITINPGSEITLLEKVIRLLLGLSKSTEVVKELQSLQLCSILALKITQHPPTEEILELCLRLLAKISYKDTQGITCVAELIDTLASFILAEERLQVSLTILANLTSNYKVASTCIKKLGNSRAVIKKLIILLSNQPSFLVVLAQSILTNVCLCYPELGETWFRTSRNVGQTVQIVFNVVLRGDNEPELQHYAVDLFMTVLRSNNLRHYLDTATPEHISHCLDEATRRLSSLPHDSATRVLQLLLALCELKASREYLYKIFGVSGQKQDLTLTPLVSLISLASDPSASTCDNTSLLALDMLRKLMKEACKNLPRMHSSLFSQVSILCTALMANAVASSPSWQSCIRLLLLLLIDLWSSGNAELQEVIKNNVQLEPLDRLVTVQLDDHQRAGVDTHNCEPVQGADIVIYALRLLQLIGERDTIHSYMQDQRIAEVLGMGLIGGSTESASAALYLLQSAISPVQSLAEQLSRMEAKRKTDANDVGKGTLPALGSGDLTQKFEKLAVTGNPENGSIEYVASLMARIGQLETDADITNSSLQSMSKLVETYRRKEALARAEVRQLGIQLETLQQQMQAEASLLEEARHDLKVFRQEVEKLEAMNAQLETEKEELEEAAAKRTLKLATQLQDAQQEYQSLSDMHAILKQQVDVFKSKLESESRQLEESVKEKKAILRQLKEKDGTLKELTSTVNSQKKDLVRKDEESDEMEKAMQQLLKDLESNKNKITELEAQVEEKEKTMAGLIEELNKYQQIAGLMQNISSSKALPTRSKK